MTGTPALNSSKMSRNTKARPWQKSKNVRNKPYFEKRNLPKYSEMMHQMQGKHRGFYSAASGTKMNREMNTEMIKFCSGTSPVP